MTDETNTTPPQGNRSGGNREPGGFRIRLSDNEMRSARALQEALRLRSTVAVLGFCVRTLGQMLEEGKLDELVEQQRSQAGNRDGGRPRRNGGERPARSEKAPRVDPFARPAKPAAAAAAQDATEATSAEPAADATSEATAEITAEITAETSPADQAVAAADQQPASDTIPAES
jgi:hypothetical protein